MEDEEDTEELMLSSCDSHGDTGGTSVCVDLCKVGNALCVLLRLLGFVGCKGGNSLCVLLRPLFTSFSFSSDSKNSSCILAKSCSSSSKSVLCCNAIALPQITPWPPFLSPLHPKNSIPFSTQSVHGDSNSLPSEHLACRFCTASLQMS